MSRAWGLLSVVGIVAVGAVGCTSGDSAAPKSAPYPARAGWLVAKESAATPTQWYDPGYPPLSVLTRYADKSELPNGSQYAGLFDERGDRLRDLSKLTKFVGVDPRPALAAALTDLFGTPAAPKVGEVKLKGGDGQEVVTNFFDERRKAMLALAKSKDASPAEAKKLEENAADLDVVGHLKLDPETLRKGGELFRNYCQTCHGPAGGGDGPGAAGLRPLPRDYRQGTFKFITCDFTADPNGGRARASRAGPT